MSTSPAPRARTARERARAEVRAEILATAQRHLAEVGPAALSLRAVARDVGMVSSAVYRYVASRDELLTLLITQAYDGLGEAAEAAEAAVARDDLLGRWSALCHAVRAWALAHPHEYALIYGTPVPGYAAPQTTVGPATRVPALLSRLLVEQLAAGWTPRDEGLPPAPVDALGPARQTIPEQVPDEMVLRGLMAWTLVFGSVSFELFGQFHQVLDEAPRSRADYFDAEVVRLARFVGLPDQA